MIKIVKVSELRGNEILARDILTDNYRILINAGEKIQSGQINKLKEFGILEVHVVTEENSLHEEEFAIFKTQTEELLKNKVKNILQKHTYGHTDVLREMIKVADKIIDEIMSIKEVQERVFDVKEKNGSLYEHMITVCALSILTGLKMELSSEKLNDIAVGSLLHDIGMQYLNNKYLDRNISDFTKEEEIDYRKHSIFGYSVLSEEKWLSDISKKIVLYHHETLDGSGYPMHMKNIPVEIEIVSICDTFDEMICGIGYRKHKIYETIEYLKVYKTKKYREKIVNTFLEFIAVFPVGTMVITNEGETGVVIRQNKLFPDRPILKIMKDKNGLEKINNPVKDLLQENTVFIEEIL